MIAFLEANSLYSIKPSVIDSAAKTYVFVGEKENRKMRESSRIIHEKLQGSILQVLPQMHHGEWSINHADDYVNKLLNILRN